jgi:hypothetical protein
VLKWRGVQVELLDLDQQMYTTRLVLSLIVCLARTHTTGSNPPEDAYSAAHRHSAVKILEVCLLQDELENWNENRNRLKVFTHRG